MIDEIDRSLREWVENTLEGVEFSLGLPGSSEAGRVVNFYLLELADSPAGLGKERFLLQFHARYLVTTRADDPEEAHRILGELAFAALENQAFEVELHPLSAQVWAALGTTPQPAFILNVPVRKELKQPDKQYVTTFLKVNVGSITSLRGVVLTSQDIPVPYAILEIPAIRRTIKADRHGEFFIPTIPASPQPLNIKVRAKGREMSFAVERPASEKEPVVIRFDPVDLPES